MELMTRLHKGSVYRVTLAFGAWYAFPPRWWPVLGPLHNDIEIFDFSRLHFHIDARFLPPKIRDRAQRHFLSEISNANLTTEIRKQGHPVDLYPLVNFVDPLVYHQTGEREHIAAKSAILERCVKVGRRRCVIEEWPSMFAWRAVSQKSVVNLCALYAGQSATGLRCPHRNVDLSTMRPHETRDGRRLLECPAHGLIFQQARSGEWVCVGETDGRTEIQRTDDVHAAAPHQA